MMQTPFLERYEHLCLKFELQAEKEGTIYLPNLPIHKPVDHVFISMEPSLGHWAYHRDPKKRIEIAKRKIKEDGFRNFIYSYRNYIFHYCVKEFFCKNPEESYHLTDLSKGAMTVTNADHNREDRYMAWYDLLKEEIETVSSIKTKYYAVGRKVTQFLKKAGFNKPFHDLLHYSQRTTKHIPEPDHDSKIDYHHFKKSISHEGIIQTAQKVLNGIDIHREIKNNILERMERAQLTEMFIKLMFYYKNRASEIRGNTSTKKYFIE